MIIVSTVILFVFDEWAIYPADKVIVNPVWGLRLWRAEVWEMSVRHAPN